MQLLDVDAAGLMLADQYGQLHAAAASSENARLLELFELRSDTGPCMDAFRTALRVVNVDLESSWQRWPNFAEAAQATGFVSVHALPLRGTDVRTGRALAATIGILAQRSVHQSELLSVQLQQALTSRVAIE